MNLVSGHPWSKLVCESPILLWISLWPDCDRKPGVSWQRSRRHGSCVECHLLVYCCTAASPTRVQPMGVLKEISQNPDNGSKSSENQNNDTISSKRALKCHFVSILCTLITLDRNGVFEHFQCLTPSPGGGLATGIECRSNGPRGAEIWPFKECNC